MAASAPLLVQQVAQIVPSLHECRIGSRCVSQSSLGLNIAGDDTKQISKVERRGCVVRVVLHQDAVETLGTCAISIFLSQQRLRKEFNRNGLRFADGKDELAVFVSASPGLFDFEAAMGSGMETHIG